MFWQEHSGTRPAWSVQYAAFVFAHDAGQERRARASLEKRQRELGEEITTRVRRLDRFWRAEDGHQQYFAQNSGQPYCVFVIAPKVTKLRKQFSHRLKS